ncbi:Uncharacterized hydrolase C22A12.06c, partial [Durusdinium trenchii]
ATGPVSLGTGSHDAGAPWTPPSPVLGRAIRVACLHGTCSNGNITKVQLQRAAKLCGDMVEFIYLDGRMKSEKDNVMWKEMSKAFKGQDLYDWAKWLEPNDVKLRKYHNLEETLNFIQGLLREHEPLDGIFGFSQGANMASLLAAEAVAGQGVTFGFVIHSCPAGPGWVEQRPELFDRKLPMRSLHISGKEDTNPVLPLLELYEDPVSVVHSDGHKVIPSAGGREEADFVAKTIADFILRAAS